LSTNGAVLGGKVNPWLLVSEKTTRTQATLALRLRLCPSARQDPKSAGRERPTRSTPPPWLAGVPDDDA
jgi:hypothetical protein